MAEDRLGDACHKFTHSHGWTRLELEFVFDRFAAAADTEAKWKLFTGAMD